MEIVKVSNDCYLAVIKRYAIAVIGNSVSDAIRAAFEELPSKA